MNEPINNSYYRSKTCDLYWGKLYSKEVKLKEVPEWLLEDPYYSVSLFKVALDPKTGISGDQHRESIEILEREIEKAKQAGNNSLLEQLQEIYEAHAYWHSISQQQESESEPPQELQSPKRKKWDARDWGIAISIFFLVLACVGFCYLVFQL